MPIIPSLYVFKPTAPILFSFENGADDLILSEFNIPPIVSDLLEVLTLDEVNELEIDGRVSAPIVAERDWGVVRNLLWFNSLSDPQDSSSLSILSW